MTVKKCCFAGHSDINDESVKEKIYKTIKYLIEMRGVNFFQVGMYGDFDKYAADSVRKAKEEYQDITLELVLPYYPNIQPKKTMYDSVIIADIPIYTPHRLKILKANEYMVNNCECLVCYVNRSFGGAAKTLAYANRKGKKIINLAFES